MTALRTCPFCQVIASMTVGKDVSALFPDVINCMQTDNLELKKLVYLYLMNYAKSQPDMAIMAVNTFVKVQFSTGQPGMGCLILHGIVITVVLYCHLSQSLLISNVYGLRVSEKSFFFVRRYLISL